MKVAFYISSLQTRGGAERALINLANYLAENNQITIVTDSGKKEDAAYTICNDIQYLTVDNCFVNFPERHIALLLSIKKLFMYLKPDIIVSFLAPTNIRLLLTGIYKSFPIVVCERNDPNSDPRSKLKRILRNYIYKKADRVVVQTEDVKKFFLQYGCKNVDVIPNFVNTIPFVRVLKEKKYVTMGRLVQQKNQKWLIDAFLKSNLSNSGYKLIIYGNGVLKDELLSFIIENNAQGNIILHDAIPDILDKINSASCFVLPSLYEGMPNALMEAMSMGLPCIATDCPCGGPRDLIKNGENGLLIGLNDQDELIKALKRIAVDSNFAEYIGNNAMKIRKTHSIERIALLWLNTLQFTITSRS